MRCLSEATAVMSERQCPEDRHWWGRHQIKGPSTFPCQLIHLIHWHLLYTLMRTRAKKLRALSNSLFLPLLIRALAHFSTTADPISKRTQRTLRARRLLSPTVHPPGAERPLLTFKIKLYIHNVLLVLVLVAPIAYFWPTGETDEFFKMHLHMEAERCSSQFKNYWCLRG